MKIIFFGSTDFSLSIAQAISARYDLTGVVIVKPKPRGRGLRVVMPKVAEWSIQQGIKVYDPEDPNHPAFIKALTEVGPRLFVLSAYGHILSGDLLRVPEFGGINVHPSLLPKYRGAAPIQRALMAGEEKTGVTVFFMDEKIDHGKIIAQEEVAISPVDTYGSLVPRLCEAACRMVIQIIDSIASGTCQEYPQDESTKTYAPKLKKEELLVDWRDPTKKIVNLIRALSPIPGAKTRFRGKEITIINALAAEKKVDIATCHLENKKIYVGTADGAIVLEEVKPENKGKISGLDFINGFRIVEGERIG